jgi:hypothetical protein
MFILLTRIKGAGGAGDLDDLLAVFPDGAKLASGTTDCVAARS